ncbi:MAG TPA: hypothetical protein VD790_09195 [Thermoleophilaceae bacterium]|nr:hypothetical protein [Thermoleophilaceae bacterium]
MRVPDALIPVLVTAAISAVYLVVDPPSTDLAAHLFRTRLFDAEGFTLWNGQWYGGHHTVSYSVTFPPIGWLLGPKLTGVFAALAATALFSALARAHAGRKGQPAAIWFAVVAGAYLFTGRIPFLLGLALGLASLLALHRGRTGIGVAAAVACAVTSPVAAMFLALAAVAHELARMFEPGPERARRPGAATAVAAAAFLPTVLLALAFPEGGWQPFKWWYLLPSLAVAVVCFAVLPARERTLRIGAALYGVSVLAAYVIHTPMGSNSTRLGELFVGPVVLLALAAREWPRSEHRRFVIAALVPLAVWAMWAPVRDYARASGDPAARGEYFNPLLDFLGDQPDGPWRVNVLFTLNHREAAEVAPHYPLARGWQRQLDVERNPLFYEDSLDPARYRRWLRNHGVRYVAVPDAELDHSSKRERELIESGLPYLEPRFTSADWRVYEVMLGSRLAVPAGRARATVTELGPSSFTVDFQRPGEALVHVGWSAYWLPEGGCAERAGNWTRVSRASPGRVRLEIDFSLGRALARDRRCG